MKPLSKTLWSLFTVSAMLVASAAAFNFHPGTQLDAAQTKAATTTLTTEILENSQFAHHQFDDEMAGKFLDEYLDALDGSHLLFLQSDLADFAQYRLHLVHDMCITGDTSPAQTIFQRYLERLSQRAAYIADSLKNEHFEFNTDEHYQYDRKNAPRPADLDAAHQLWRQNLRSEYLQEKLAGKKDAEIAQTLAHRSSRLVQTMRKLDDNAVLDLYLNALAHVYDPHSDYMDREQLQSFNIAMNHSLVGIGATLQSEDGYCKIGSLVPGGPAARSAQLKPGDRVVAVSQGEGKGFTDLVDMPLPQVVDLIRGAKGSTVRLEVIPAGAAENAARKMVALVRDAIKLEDQQAKARIVDFPVAGAKTQRIGVIDLPGFYAGEDSTGVRTSATADVARLVRKLEQQHVTGLILDLRRNGGGSLEEAINLAGLFIGSGPVVQTRTLDGRVNVGASQDERALYEGPLIVLTSRMSASASEIVAGALQDYGRAVIVGDSSTFGKGTVQTMVPLAQAMERQGVIPDSDPGELKVTISKFYRPSGQSTQLAGVKSDIVLPSLTDIPEISEAKLDNPLPWDTVPSADFSPQNLVRPSLAELKAHSTARIAKDPDFIWLRQERERFSKDGGAKSVSLNESERRHEIASTKAAAEALKKEQQTAGSALPRTYEITLKNVAQPGPGEPLKNSRSIGKEAAGSQGSLDDAGVDQSSLPDDAILLETERILCDYSGLLSEEKVATATPSS